MMKRLKSLDETITEIEREIKKNPNVFLITTLERLKLYREQDIESLVVKVSKVQRDNKRSGDSGFRGFGVP